MGKAVLEQFGTYYLLDTIAEGGMAEVFRARFARPEANERIFVLKRILPQILKSRHKKHFLEMFHKEIQLCMGFHHPNIIQIFDFGEIDQTPFLAMEYVEGRTLAQITKHYQKHSPASLGHPLPVNISAGICFLTCCALEYIHSYKSRATLEHRPVIHRDLSPQNILISYEGNVKLIDFGISKLALEAHEIVLPRTLKGKIAYFSPEQAAGHSIDVRSDIFALGVILWEQLTGKRLFFEPELSIPEILAKVKNCAEILPPSCHNSSVPKSLDLLVLRALQKNPEARFQTSTEMKEEFEKVLRDLNLRSLGPQIGAFIQNLLPHEIAQDRERLQTLNHLAQARLSTPISSSTSTIAPIVQAPPTLPIPETPTPARKHFATTPLGIALILVLGLVSALTSWVHLSRVKSQQHHRQAASVMEGESSHYLQSK